MTHFRLLTMATLGLVTLLSTASQSAAQVWVNRPASVVTPTIDSTTVAEQYSSLNTALCNQNWQLAAEAIGPLLALDQTSPTQRNQLVNLRHLLITNPNQLASSITCVSASSLANSQVDTQNANNSQTFHSEIQQSRLLHLNNRS